MDTSYLSQQVTSIIAQLHDLFDEIGVPNNERDSRESELFSSLSETLHNHLRVVSSEKNDLIEQGQNTITTIKQMEASLHENKASHKYGSNDGGLTVTYPLSDCLRGLKEKHKAISKLHQDRWEQIKKLVQALESYSSHLEPSFVQIKLPPSSSDATVPPTFDLSPSYINSVDSEFTRVYEEYTKRVSTVKQCSEDIVKLWAELGTPQAQTESLIVENWRDSPEQLGLHTDDIAQLKSRREKLSEEKRGRERRLKDLRAAVESLWERLDVDEQVRRSFTARNRGCGLRAINDLEDELSRLNELKRQNLHLFVEHAREKLHALWDELYFSEEEAVEFTPMFCDVFSDALLSAHEGEISRLEALKEQRAPLLELVSKHKSIMQDKDDLANSSQDASRLIAKKGEKHDPTRLLREEKMRKRIARELPKVEQKLQRTLNDWEQDYGRPFLVFGERYLDVIAASNARAPPPRTKTPNSMPPPPKPGARSAPQPQRTDGNRDVSNLRSKTPAPTGSTTRNPLASSGSAYGTSTNKSPSRIPARVPLGNMPHGSNSPERQYRRYQDSKGQENSTLRGNIGAPKMAPPPKMRDLYAPPSGSSTPSSVYPSDVPRSGSVVRHVPPDDPYSDHQYLQHSQLGSSQMSSSLQTSQNGTCNVASSRDMPPPPRPAYNNQQWQIPRGHQQSNSHYPDHHDAASTISASSANSRQISNTSSAAALSIASSHTTAASGSENWETFDDSEVEEEVEYAEPPQRMWGAGAKRTHAGGSGAMAANGYPGAYHGGYTPPGNKRVKGIGVKGVGAAKAETIIEGGGEDTRGGLVEGSDAGWTDEDAC